MRGTIGFYMLLVPVTYLLVSPIVFAATTTHLTATHSTTSSAHATATPSAQIPTYNIGILFPNASDVRKSDPALNNMILTSELAIQLAQQNVRSLNILPDVELNFTRYYSSEFSGGKTAWTTTRMIEDGVNAVIGDMVSNTSEISAGLTGIFQIPQCSCGASSLALSNKDNYPYFFRTMGNVVVYGRALMEWIRQMNWTMFALVYTDDGVGQQILASMLTKSYQYGITPVSQIPLYNLHQDDITIALQTLITSGSRVVIVADSNPANQILILQVARSMGMLSEGWVWMLTNDLSEALTESIDTQEIAAFDGLMFISGLWNLTNVPAYNDLYGLWQQQPVPKDFVDQYQWNTLGLSYNGPNAYSCAEVLVLGLNKALDEYIGGRQQGLADLAAKSFNSTRMTPTFYNMNYTGPAGLMSFTESGDQETGHFGLLYMKNGSTVTFAELDDGIYKSIPNVPVLYLGSTHRWPADMATRSLLNPMSTQVAGLAIYAVAGIGMVLCALTMVLILCYRNLKMVLISSPIFLCLQLVGIFSAYVSVILYVNNVTVAKCIARQLTLLVGFILVIGSIIAKNYRIYRVFQNVYTIRASRLQSVYLLRLVVLFGVVTILPLVVWFALYPIEPTSYLVSMNTYCMVCAYPTSNKHVDWIHINVAELACALLCYALIFIASLLAWKTRKVSSTWSESQQIGYISYTTGLAALVTAPAFFLPIELYQVAIYLKLTAILFSATFTFFVLFLTKLIFICKYMASQKWWNIFPRRHLKHFHGDGMGSRNELTGRPFEFETPAVDSDDSSNNAVAKNLLDSTTKAHEGILPVKKQARFQFMSIWQLKHVVVIPSRQTFMLMTTTGNKAEYHQYVSCQKMPRNDSDGYLFCVWTDDNTQLYFQVHDENALDRWMDWFNNKSRPYDNGVHHSEQHLGGGQRNKLPSTSTLGAAAESHLNAPNHSGTMASSDQFLDSFAAPRPAMYQHQHQHQQNFTPSVLTDNTGDVMETYNFYGGVPHKIDSNPISTFGCQ